MAHIVAWIAIIFGFLLVVDSFTTIQVAFGGEGTTFFNVVEFVLGVLFIGIGAKMRELK